VVVVVFDSGAVVEAAPVVGVGAVVDSDTGSVVVGSVVVGSVVVGSVVVEGSVGCTDASAVPDTDTAASPTPTTSHHHDRPRRVC
jgi:hypothetical protein